jgi:hypothetical protein
MKIAQENGCFRASNYQDKINDAQKAEHVVELMRPNAIQNEKELNEYATEW